MAAVLNAQLTTMLTALDGAATGLGNEFVAHVGSTMAMAAAMPADWFPKTGTPTAAQIASFLMRLHDLTTIVWANYPTAGVTCMADWIVPTGSNLTEAIRTELLQTGAAPGSGTIHAGYAARPASSTLHHRCALLWEPHAVSSVFALSENSFVGVCQVICPYVLTLLTRKMH